MDNINERLAVLETKQDHSDASDAIRDKKIDEMYEVIMKLKGAKWVGWFIAAAFGFLISNLNTLWHLFTQGK